MGFYFFLLDVDFSTFPLNTKWWKRHQGLRLKLRLAIYAYANIYKNQPIHYVMPSSTFTLEVESLPQDMNDSKTCQSLLNLDDKLQHNLQILVIIKTKIYVKVKICIKSIRFFTKT